MENITICPRRNKTSPVGQCTRGPRITKAIIVVIYILSLGLVSNKLNAETLRSPALIEDLTTTNSTYSAPDRSDKRYKYLRVGLGVGYGRSDISPDKDMIYHNDGGFAFGFRLSLERPIAPLLSAHAAIDAFGVSHSSLFQDSTSSFVMALATGLSIGRRDVPGNFHFTGSIGYGFASIGDDNTEDDNCLTLVCGDADKGGAVAGSAYRLAAGYTNSSGALIELVAQRVGGEGDDFPDGTDAYIYNFMIMISSGLGQ